MISKKIKKMNEIRCKYCNKKIHIMTVNHWFKRVRSLQDNNKKHNRFDKAINNSPKFYTNIIKYPETAKKPFVFCSKKCKELWMFKNTDNNNNEEDNKKWK